MSDQDFRKLEGRQETKSNKGAKAVIEKAVIWIALGSALAGILASFVSLIKSFWA